MSDAGAAHRSIARRVVGALAAAVLVLSAAASAAPLRDEAGTAQALFARLAKADAVAEGPKDSSHVVYVFFDANCFYCHLTWKALQPYAAVGLQVRWVPVAYQQPSSVGRAAAIMQAPDRVAALRENETHYDASKFDGGIAPKADVPEQLVEQLQANTRLMRAFGAPGTPLLVWKRPGGDVRYKVGVPRLSELPGITGLPQQRNDDPALAEFR